MSQLFVYASTIDVLEGKGKQLDYNVLYQDFDQELYEIFEYIHRHPRNGDNVGLFNEMSLQLIYEAHKELSLYTQLSIITTEVLRSMVRGVTATANQIPIDLTPKSLWSYAVVCAGFAKVLTIKFGL